MSLNSFSGRVMPTAPVEGGQELLLGWNSDSGAGPFGSMPEPRGWPDASAAVTYDGDEPLLTCASTGAGKGRGVLIPTLLQYPGPVICMDIKGELFQVTNRRRREMGQRVVALDPFRVMTTRSDSLNPLDLLTLPRADSDSDAEMLASLLAVGNEYASDPFWNTTANGLLAALIAQIASNSPNDRHLGRLRDWLYHHDMEYAIAGLLDKKAVKSRMARDLFAAYLTAPHDKTRPCIRTMACSYVSALGSELVVESLRASSFRLLDVYEGKPLSIYIIIPPEKLESHRSLLRLWIGTLLTAVTRRTVMPRQRTLFLLDECAQLGSLPILRQAISLLRGSGLQTWTFWQDLSQLRQCYPSDWQTILNNSRVLQVFGIANHNQAKEWAELMNLHPHDLDQLAREDVTVMCPGHGSLICRRPDYLKDDAFAGLFDANQRFGLQGQTGLGQM